MMATPSPSPSPVEFSKEHPPPLSTNKSFGKYIYSYTSHTHINIPF